MLVLAVLREEGRVSELRRVVLYFEQTENSRGGGDQAVDGT